MLGLAFRLQRLARRVCLGAENRREGAGSVSCIEGAVTESKSYVRGGIPDSLVEAGSGLENRIAFPWATPGRPRLPGNARRPVRTF
jgi:hypothetical protein